jgi:predicted nucleotidyltransferase
MGATRARARAILWEETEQASDRVRCVLLFGGQARGEARSDSSCDFRVIVGADAFAGSERIVAERSGVTAYPAYLGGDRSMSERAVWMWVRKAEDDLNASRPLGWFDKLSDRSVRFSICSGG